MKKYLSMMAAIAVTLSLGLTSCSDDDDDDVVKGADPELLSFGFTEALNAEVLSADYEGVIELNAVKVTMPKFADKSSLVATFTVAEGNTVTVNGVTQESGVTANDFSVPVDYIVSNAKGTMNVKYTVTVEAAADYVWSEVARYTEIVPRGSNAIMKINPVDNTPYIAFVTKATPNKVVAIKYADGGFSYLGSQEGESGEVAAGRFDFAISNTGTPYYIYSDNSITTPVKASATVMKYNGTSWSNVGEPGITGFVPNILQIGILGDEVITMNTVNANKDTYLKRELYSSIYNGSWATSQVVKNSAVECLTTTDNAAYIYTISYDEKNYSVLKYENGTWTGVGDRVNYVEAGASMPPIVMTSAASIVAKNNGDVYVLSADDAVTKDEKNMQFFVIKYSAETQEWSKVGGTYITSVAANDMHISAKIALAPDGTPFFAYTDYKGDTFAKVLYLDNETKQWTEPVTLSSNKSSNINISFCDNGEAYCCFVETVGGEDQIVLMKYAAK